jgi:hypothetical protein
MIYLPSFHRERFCLLPALLLVATVIFVGPAVAVERIYNIVSNQSNIAISGTVTSSSLGTAAIQQQGPGSLVTSYTGMIRTDRGPNTIQFLAGSAADASLNGNWQPRSDGSSGNAPADYGGRVPFNALATLFFAARDVVGDLTSGTLPISSGNFNLSNVNLTFTSGSIAYRDSPFGLESGFRPLVGESGALSGTGSLTSQTQTGGGVLETLSIPVNATVLVTTSQGNINLMLAGKVVVTATLPAPLVGDFNADGSVDAADYVVWREGALIAPTQVNYDLWRQHFGQTAGGNGATAVLAPNQVPEPTALLLITVACITTASRRAFLESR